MNAIACEFIDYTHVPPGFNVQQVTDFIIPGRGLTPDGNGIEQGTQMRAWAVGNFFARYGVAARGGLIVCSANRSPRANPGEPWFDQELGESFEQGIPEAEGLRRALAELEYVPPDSIIKQQRSFDTAGDIRRGEDRLLEEFASRGIDPSGRLVLIAAQRAHLIRVEDPIAPHTLRLPFVGGVVPEENPAKPDAYPLVSSLASRYIVHGLNPKDPETSDIIDGRARKVFKGVMRTEKIAQTVIHGGKVGQHARRAA